MSVRPHKTKYKSYPGKTYWTIDIGYGRNREHITFEGTYEAACQYEKEIRSTPKKEKVYNERIKDLILPFLEAYKQDVSARTYEDCNTTIDNHLVPRWGLLRPDQLTMQHFTDFKTELEAEGISPSTINKHLSYISKILKWAAANVRSEELPFRVPRYSRKKTTPDPVKPLTRRQVNEIYKHIQPPYQFIFLLMADMGLRRQEAMTVKIQDIDERFKAINIRGKGSKIRRIPFMTDRFEQAALSVLELKIDGYATVNPETEKPYLNIRKELIRAGKAAGIKRKVGHHLLRHSFATWCAEEGMNPHALQRIMGHSSIETTNKIYTHVGSDFIGKEVMRMREKKNEKKIKKPHLYVVKN